MPVVDYLIPALGFNDFLYQTLDSLSKDDFVDKKVILILNSKSPPNYLDLTRCEQFGLNLTVVHEPTLGISQALNAGLKHCKGEFVARLDADDINNQYRTRLQVEHLLSNLDLYGVGSTAVLIDEDSNYLGLLEVPRIRDLAEMQATLRFENPYLHPSTMVRRDALMRMGYGLNMTGCQDWDLWVRMAKAGMLMSNITKPLIKYRIHSRQESQSKERESFIDPLREVLRKLDPALTQQYCFQRPYLESKRLTLISAVGIFLREYPNLKNLYSFKKLAAGLVRSVSK